MTTKLRALQIVVICINLIAANYKFDGGRPHLLVSLAHIAVALAVVYAVLFLPVHHSNKIK